MWCKSVAQGYYAVIRVLWLGLEKTDMHTPPEYKLSTLHMKLPCHQLQEKWSVVRMLLCFSLQYCVISNNSSMFTVELYQQCASERPLLAHPLCYIIAVRTRLVLVCYVHATIGLRAA